MLPDNTKAPSKHEGQVSVPSDMFLYRIPFAFRNPSGYSAETWRNVVASQLVATVCKETLIANILSLDWQIVVRDSKYRDELSATVRYYTKLFENAGYGGYLDFTSHVEWISADLLDTPFGGASEIGRRNQTRNGRVVWIEPLDSGTLYPTLNHEYPVAQNLHGQVVYFDKDIISRTYMSPRTDSKSRGWGMAPPEKVFRALEMLANGDVYYANLLLDIPPVGILDLGDMSEPSAKSWVESWRALLNNAEQSSFKIPVLYEHTTDTKFISLGKAPNDIMYDRITLKYASLVAAGYGMSLSDIGMQTTSASGETLAGSIRQERRTKRTGFARLKKKLKHYFDVILPETLEFKWIDYDDELNVALGRTRLSNSTAWTNYIKAGMFTPQEARLQSIADGMVTISVPENIPDEPQSNDFETTNEPELLGEPVPPSSGGEGEIRKYKITFDLWSFKSNADVYLELFNSVVSSLGDEESILLHKSKVLLLDDVSTYSVFDSAKGYIEIKAIDDSEVSDIVVSKCFEVLCKYIGTLLQSEYFDGVDLDIDSSYNTIIERVFADLEERHVAIENELSILLGDVE